MVIALNMMDEANQKGLNINVKALDKLLGMPVVPTVALMGQGISELFVAAVAAVRQATCPLPQPASKHICDSLQPLSQGAEPPGDTRGVSRAPPAAADAGRGRRSLFPRGTAASTSRNCCRSCSNCAARPQPNCRGRWKKSCMPTAITAPPRCSRPATRMGAPHEGRGWRYWLDELFLHPQWG